MADDLDDLDALLEEPYKNKIINSNFKTCLWQTIVS